MVSPLMRTETESVVIVGAGPAGGRAALALRDAGFAGKISMVGAETYLPYERPPLSKGILTGEANIDRLFLADATVWTERRIDVRLGCPVIRIDSPGRTVELSDGVRLDYDYLVMATGGRPRRLRVPGAESAGLLYLRNIEDALAIRARLSPGTCLCVIGGGVIGLEVAASARTLGVEVVVIETATTPLGRVAPSLIGDWMAELHRERGIDLLMGESVESLQRSGAATIVQTSSGKRIKADLVVAGIGIEPNVELLAGSPLDLSNGIVVDECGRSADPRIFAVGDVARAYHPRYAAHIRAETWRNAENHGRAVAAAITGQPAPEVPVPWMWTDQYDVNLQVAGIVPAGSVEWVVRGSIASRKFTALALVDHRVVAGCTINQGRDMRVIQQLISHASPVECSEIEDANRPLSAFVRADASLHNPAAGLR